MPQAYALPPTFERGCDDYVAKPFSYPELRARVGALLARANQRRAMGRLRVGDLEVHPSSRRVLLRGTPIELSQKEFALLRTLATEPTKVWTKEELLRSIWGFRSIGTSRNNIKQSPAHRGLEAVVRTILRGRAEDLERCVSL